MVSVVRPHACAAGHLFDLQTIKHKLAQLKTDISVARAFYDQCLLLHIEKKLDHTMASMAKLHCTELQNKVADECLQMHGGASCACDVS